MSLFQGLHAGIAGGITWGSPGRLNVLSHEKPKENIGFIPTPKEYLIWKKTLKYETISSCLNDNIP